MEEKISKILEGSMSTTRAKLKANDIVKLFNEKVLLNDFLIYIYGNFPNERLNHKTLRNSMLIYLGEEDQE